MCQLMATCQLEAHKIKNMPEKLVKIACGNAAQLLATLNDDIMISV